MNVQQVYEKVLPMDLSEVKKYVVERVGIAQDDVDELEQEYKKYLVLCITGGGVPPEKIDIFWHAHILHSSSYLQMCKDVFEGKYLMHMPDTLRRYEKYFGNPPSVWSRDNLSPANHCFGCSCCGPDPSNKTFIIQ